LATVDGDIFGRLCGELKRGGGVVKEVARYNWNIEMKGQQYNTEVQLDNIVGLYVTGSGQCKSPA
jgi:hypothetical protein